MLDGGANVTMIAINSTAFRNNTVLNSADGQHSVLFYCNDSANNLGASSKVYYTIDTTAPTYSLNSTNSTTAGASIKHSLFWQDNMGLSGYIFSFDNGTGTFVNDSYMYFGEIPQNSSDWRNGLVGMWHLNNDTNDYSDNGNNGIENGGVNCSANVAGKFGAACKFDGSDDYVSLSDTSSLNITGNISVMAWVNPAIADQTNVGILSKQVQNEDAHPYILWLWEYPVFDIRIGTTRNFVDSTGGSLSQNQWYQVVGTYNGSQMEIYVNGNKTGSVAATGVINSTGASYIKIGQRNQWGGNFNGTIDDLRPGKIRPRGCNTRKRGRGTGKWPFRTSLWLCRDHS